jgi:acyl transferase domain-containing protein
MAAGLAEWSPVFADHLEECAQALEPHTGWGLLDVLYRRGGAPGLDRVEVVQPALFAVMVALAKLWQAHGVRPDAVIGHSQGEIAAAHIAGALSLEDAARVVALRSRALAALAGSGAMASLPVSAEDARGLVEGRADVFVAALNGPSATVVAGGADAVAELVEFCQGRGIDAKAIAVDYASHSPHMAALRDPILSALEGLNPTQGSIPFYSTLTGGLLDDTTVLTGEYWYENLSNPVLFHPTVSGLVDEGGHRLFVEASPHPVLVPSLDQALSDVGGRALGTLRREQGDGAQFLTSLATAHTLGASVDWGQTLPSGTGGPLPALPTYPFQRQRYWLTDTGIREGDAAGMGLTPAGHSLLATATHQRPGSSAATR